MLVAVGFYYGTGDLFSSGRYHHFVPSLVFGQCKDRICGVSDGETGLFEEQAQLTTCFRMDQIVNTLSIYAIENGLLTRCVPGTTNTKPVF